MLLLLQIPADSWLLAVALLETRSEKHLLWSIFAIKSFIVVTIQALCLLHTDCAISYPAHSQQAVVPKHF
jgi:hypothetical protein